MSRLAKPASELVVCRVCLSHGKQLVPFARYDADRKAYRLADAISAVGAVQVENGDGLPQYCCVRCLREIESAFKIRRVCQESDWRLREMYQQLEPEPVVEVMKEEEELVFKEEYEESRLQEIETGVVAIKQEVEELPQALDGADFAVSIKEEIDEVLEVAESDEAVEEQCQSDGDVTREAKICCGCSQYCLSKEELIKHSLKFHYPQHSKLDKLRPFACDICYRNLPNKNDLNAHKRHFRDERKKYECGKCGKGFYTTKSLNLHRGTHGSSPLNCYMCPFIATTTTQLRAHVQKHSSSNGTFKCFVCETFYSTPTNLKKHTATHPYKLPQKCPYCPRVFNLKKCLTNHINKHRQHGELGNQGIESK
uniref:Zinc finger and SCAN domain-containing protein 32 n=1 Tax=Culex pipiens TaxID=7175 RepID=A0A8D8A7Y6_CULPI